MFKVPFAVSLSILQNKFAEAQTNVVEIRKSDSDGLLGVAGVRPFWHATVR